MISFLYKIQETKKYLTTLFYSFFLCIPIFYTFTVNAKLYSNSDKEPHKINIHREIITDNYHWLRDQNWPIIKNDKIINRLEKENQHTEEYFALYSRQQDILIKEIANKTIEEDSTYPVKHGNYYYYYRQFAKGKNNFIICGHFGKDGRYDDLKKRATMYNFILLNIGIF